MQRHVVLCALIVVIGTSSLADPPKRNPWHWTDEERIAQRFDPFAIRARLEAAAAEGLMPTISSGIHPRVQGQTADSSTANVIIGRHNPELFLPFELFNWLVKDGFAVASSERDSYRDRLAPIVSQFADPNVFWSTLGDAAALYIAGIRKETQVAERLREATSDDERKVILRDIETLQKPQCGLRHDALLAAVSRIGRENLYRALYQGVAPGLSTVSDEGEVPPSRLRFIAGGCR